jgi:hypothetical protein
MSKAAHCPPQHAASAPIATAPPRQRQPWLPREDRALRASAGVVPSGEVAARLGRSRPAILARAHVLGLHWYRPRPGQPHPGYTLHDVARLLGVGGDTARRWVAAGWLPAARREVRLGRNALWLVGADDLEHFLRECRPVYAPWRFRDPAWRAFAAALPPERDPWLTPCEAARLLHLTPHGVQRRIASGQLVARRWDGRYYIRRSALNPRPAAIAPCPPVPLTDGDGA